MRNFQLALRNFFKKGNGNLIKILSLGAGLALGLVLIVKVCFETSYDSFYKDGDSIYLISMGFSRGKDIDNYDQIPGAVAPGMQEEVPGVEYGTRVTWLWDDGVFRTPDKKKYKGELMLADTNFLNVFPRRILAGDPAVLGQPRYLLVSESFANAMGGFDAAMGATLFNDQLPDVALTVGGVFEDVPENTEIKYDLLLSLETIDQWSRNNWLGNERYKGYIKVQPGMDPDALAPAIRAMQEKYQDLEYFHKQGVDLWYTLKPFDRLHTDNPEVKRMNILLSLLAFTLLFTAVMNYILVVISSLINRTREVGVRKCYGAEGPEIRNIMLSETALHIGLSLIVAAGIILACKGAVENLLGASLGALFTPRSFLIIGAVVVGVFLLSGLIPAWMFQRIPISAAFRHFKESRRRWKLGLLLFQFMASAFLVILLVVITKQYRTILNDDPGYAYEDLLYCNLTGVTHIQIQQAMDRVATLPQVAKVGAGSEIPLYAGSGNNVRLPGSDNDLFNICDLYYGSANYTDIMGFKILEGRAATALNEIMVSRQFIAEMERTAGWKDGVVGQTVWVSEHSESKDQLFTITGVYDDVLVGNRTMADDRASILFFHHDLTNAPIMLIKLHQLNEGDVMAITQLLEEALPDKDIQVRPYRDEIRLSYQEAQKFKSSVLIGGITTLIISLVGLIGYTNDETNRRRKEIAIRKINGGTAKDILLLFLKDMLFISLPAFAAGSLVAYFLAVKWLEQFSLKTALNAGLFIVPSLCLLVLIMTVVTIDSLRIARSNPVSALVSE